MEIITISKEELFSGIRAILSEVLATQLDEPQPKNQERSCNSLSSRYIDDWKMDE